MGPRRMVVLIGALLIFAIVQAHGLFAAQQNKQDLPPADQIGEVISHGADGVPTNGNSGPPQLQRRNPRYEVVNGDVISIEFPYTPKFDQTVTVNPDGYITLRDVGGIHVEGETVPQIKGDIAKAYATILRDPEVSVTLKQFATPYFLALGQVNKPGKYDLRGPTTVAEAVAMAGGFTGKGKRNDIILFRRVSDSWVSATKVNLKHMLSSKNLGEDLQLHPGDMIYVPQNKLSKIKPFIPLPSLSYYLH
jgi:protein involved in polysaccharide export with SLBB domain